MALYTNTNPDSPIISVEFSPTSEGNITFLRTVASNNDKITEWLTANGQSIISETLVEGQRILVTRGPKSQQEIMQLLNSNGENFKITGADHAFQPWKWRGNVTMAGHILQYISSGMRPGGVSAATKIFAGSNILANLTNIIFGAEESPDTNRLHYFKEKFNEQIHAELPGINILPVTDKRAALHAQPQKPKSLGQKATDFMRHYSVRFGEIGLRFFGAFALAFPVANWKSAAQALGKGALKEAYNLGKNENSAHFVAGSAYFLGKVVALFSKAPDPYADASKHNAFETFRTEYSFKLGGLIEGIAPFFLIKDYFTNPKMQITLPNNKFLPESIAGKPFRGAKTTDFIGGTAGILFAIGQTIRFFAPFGTRKVDMNEIYAHITDTLALAPKDKLPQLLAQSAAAMQTHFKEQKLEFGQVYTQLANDLYRYHGIALPDQNTPAPALQENETTPVKTFAERAPRASAKTIIPPASHREKLALNPTLATANGLM